MDPLITFYQTLAGTSFTLLSLWLGVLQFAHGGWRTDPRRHRWGTHAALHFFLPGMASLASMLAAGTSGLIWRVTFVVAGLAGLIEAVSFLRAPNGPKAPSFRALRFVDPILYGLMVVAAVLPRGTFALPPLQIPGMVTGALFLVGLCYVWLALAERRPEDAATNQQADTTAAENASLQPGPVRVAQP
ncbi:hypothetical protein [Geodermatophilus sp. SYSU D00710]